MFYGVDYEIGHRITVSSFFLNQVIFLFCYPNIYMFDLFFFHFFENKIKKNCELRAVFTFHKVNLLLTVASCFCTDKNTTCLLVLFAPKPTANLTL